MRYRRLDSDGDHVLGHGQDDYLVDCPECVAQAVVTRLRLLAGEWFLDLQEGMPYATRVFGKHTPQSYNPLIRARILETEGVRELTSYAAHFDGDQRRLSVEVTLNTVYGPISLSTEIA